jgi:protein-tyrosine phosphatase
MMYPKYDASLLFVCLGNICRSPVAEAVCRQHITRMNLNMRCDSAGLHDYHSGEWPDSRTLENAAVHQLDMSGIRSRKITPDDWNQWDWIIAMDRSVFIHLKTQCPEQTHRQVLYEFMTFNPQAQWPEVPDPYYGTANDFEQVYQLCMSTMPWILQKVKLAML